MELGQPDLAERAVRVHEPEDRAGEEQAQRERLGALAEQVVEWPGPVHVDLELVVVAADGDGRDDRRRPRSGRREEEGEDERDQRGPDAHGRGAPHRLRAVWSSTDLMRIVSGDPCQ